MPTISITRLYDLMSIKLGKETAENLTTFIEEKIRCEVDTKTSILATKEDLARESGNIRADMIKWMFVFWVGQALTTFGLILLFLKK
jgi:hypothetical protein